MAKQRKAGLSYFYKGVNEWDDSRIIDLVGNYGPQGFAVFDVVRSLAFQNGYYLELPMKKIAMLVMREVGNRWIQEASFVEQVGITRMLILPSHEPDKPAIPLIKNYSRELLEYYYYLNSDLV